MSCPKCGNPVLEIPNTPFKFCENEKCLWHTPESEKLLSENPKHDISEIHQRITDQQELQRLRDFAAANELTARHFGHGVDSVSMAWRVAQFNSHWAASRRASRTADEPNDMRVTGNPSSIPPTKRSKPAKRDQAIFEIIQAGYEGLDYCREMDRRGIRGKWENFPGYANAYKESHDWKTKIWSEKDRIARRTET